MKFDAWAIWFYAVCLAIFLMASALNLNGSSISIYQSLYGHGAPEKPIVGHPHWIRLDEWDFHTPAILNQTVRLRPFRVKNSPEGAHSVSLLGNIPVAHVTTIFRPQFWPFFFLPVEYAYSAYWQFKALILLTGVFTWLLLLTESTLWAATGSLWFFFSPLTQWAYSWPSLLPEMIGSICFAVVFACYLTVGRNRLALTLAAVGFSVCAINFGLCAYLPHMIPLVWVTAIFFAGWCIAKRSTILSKDELTRRRIMVAAVTIGVITVIAALTYFQARAAITGIADTVYPGKRRFVGGTMTLPSYLENFFDWFTNEGRYPLPLGNICEAAGFLWLAPAALFCMDRLKLPHFKISFVALCCSSMLLLSWLLLPLPKWFGGLLALNETGEARPTPALGLANVAIVALVMASFPEDKRLQGTSSFAATARRVLGALMLVAILLILTDRGFHWFFSLWQMVLAIALTTLLISLVLHGSQRVLPILLVVPSALVFGMANPVERGIGVITSSAMYRFVHADQHLLNSKWIVFSDSFWGPGFLTATGCQVYNGLHYLPDIDHFGLFAGRGLDVHSFNQDGYLLIHPIDASNKTSVQLIQPGWTRWNVNPSDPILKQLGIKYAAFDQEPSDTIAAQLVPLNVKPVDGYWLYSIP